MGTNIKCVSDNRRSCVFLKLRKNEFRKYDKQITLKTDGYFLGDIELKLNKMRLRFIKFQKCLLFCLVCFI